MDENLVGHIYILLFPNGKRYVGQTVQGVEERLDKHFADTRRGCALPVHNAMRRYGKESMIIEKVSTLKCTQEYLDLIEVRAIKYYNTLAPNGYNLTEGGRGGVKSEEVKAKISAAHKGMHHSQETKAKISAIRMGVLRSEETKAKISLNSARKGKPGVLMGKHHSEETKIQMSASRKGKSKPWLKGKCRSEETKAKISATMKKIRAERSLKVNKEAA